MELFEKLQPNISTGISKVICFEHVQDDLDFRI